MRWVWGLVVVGFVGLGLYIGTAYDQYKAAHTPLEIDGLEIEFGDELDPTLPALSAAPSGTIR